MLPGFLQVVGQVFPLAWMAKGLRSVFLPDALAAMEPSGSWELPLVAAVLLGWTVVGAVVTRLTFRWRAPRVR